MNRNRMGFANSAKASVGGSNCKKIAITGINKLVNGKGMDSVTHSMATITSNANACCALRLSKTGKNKRTPKTVKAIRSPVRFIFFFSTGFILE